MMSSDWIEAQAKVEKIPRVEGHFRGMGADAEMIHVTGPCADELTTGHARLAFGAGQAQAERDSLADLACNLEVSVATGRR